MKNSRICFLLIVSFLIPFAFAQKAPNRLNKQGRRTGKWIVFLDSAQTLKSMEGRFRNGNVVGKAYYYNMAGVLERKEINRFKKLKTTFYYPNGLKRMKGSARLESTVEKAHYYFYGRWEYYDENEKLLKYLYYEKGKLVKTEYLDKNTKINDTLINLLNSLEKRFLDSSAGLIAKIDVSDHLKSEKLRMQLIERESVLFLELENLLNHSGYPTVIATNESANIPFFIISYATSGIRQKYLEMFQKAANAGDINAKSFAFYVDKLKLAQGEKQVYGTQDFFDAKNRTYLPYPTIDPDNLQQRRASVGLE